MVLPLVRDDILEYFLVDGAAADVDGEVFALVLDFEELGDGIDVVTIKFLDARGGEGHGDDPRRNVGEV